MKSCAHCGLPAPQAVAACGVCRRPFPVGPASCRLEPAGPAWLWLRDGEVDAVAETSPAGWWTVRDAPSDRAVLGLVPLPARTAVGVVDPRGRIVGVVTARGMRDAAGDRRFAVADNEIGYHVVDADGTVAAAGSRSDGGIDVVVAPEAPRNLVVAVTLATELLRQAATV